MEDKERRCDDGRGGVKERNESSGGMTWEVKCKRCIIWMFHQRGKMIYEFSWFESFQTYFSSSSFFHHHSFQILHPPVFPLLNMNEENLCKAPNSVGSCCSKILCMKEDGFFFHASVMSERESLPIRYLSIFLKWKIPFSIDTLVPFTIVRRMRRIDNWRSEMAYCNWRIGIWSRMHESLNFTTKESWVNCNESERGKIKFCEITEILLFCNIQVYLDWSFGNNETETLVLLDSCTMEQPKCNLHSNFTLVKSFSAISAHLKFTQFVTFLSLIVNSIMYCTTTWAFEFHHLMHAKTHKLPCEKWVSHITNFLFSVGTRKTRETYCFKSGKKLKREMKLI